MRNFGRLNKAKFKTLNDIYTKMDTRAETIIIGEIRRHFPDASIYSEERGADIKGLEYTWLIDPIDGTINYFHGHAPFRVGICLVRK
jgi:myo-inositol-1(or 4)-monophosphatase